MSGLAAKVENPRKHTAAPTGRSPANARKTRVVGCFRNPGINRARTSGSSGLPFPIASREYASTIASTASWCSDKFRSASVIRIGIVKLRWDIFAVFETESPEIDGAATTSPSFLRSVLAC